MIGDMNESALRPASTVIVPLIVPVTIEVEGGLVKRFLHNVTDAELQFFVGRSDPDEGWRWARALAWVLAGQPPREWSPRKLGEAGRETGWTACRCGKFNMFGLRNIVTAEADGRQVMHAHSDCKKVAWSSRCSIARPRC